MYNNYLGNTMFPRPEGGTKQTFIGGNSVVIPKQTQQNPEKFEAAKEFVRWVNSEEGSRVTLENGYFPGTQSAFELDIAQQEPAKTLYEPFNEALSKGHAPPIHPSYEEVVAPIRTAISEALQRNQTPEEALTAAVSKIDKALQG
jgi:ABC-type glycerol-3-phosphate transport system substrate-binding protein